MTERRDMPRCGDYVLHRPTGETWVVAWCEGCDLAWCGWPNGMARTHDCEIVRRSTDDEHTRWVATVANCGDSRADRVQRLYADVLR
jgi:hypothetical protein